jgi:hypothetical protein
MNPAPLQYLPNLTWVLLVALMHGNISPPKYGRCNQKLVYLIIFIGFLLCTAVNPTTDILYYRTEYIESGAYRANQAFILYQAFFRNIIFLSPPYQFELLRLAPVLLVMFLLPASLRFRIIILLSPAMFLAVTNNLRQGLASILFLLVASHFYNYINLRCEATSTHKGLKIFLVALILPLSVAMHPSVIYLYAIAALSYLACIFPRKNSRRGSANAVSAGVFLTFTYPIFLLAFFLIFPKVVEYARASSVDYDPDRTAVLAKYLVVAGYFLFSSIVLHTYTWALGREIIIFRSATIAIPLIVYFVFDFGELAGRLLYFNYLVDPFVFSTLIQRLIVTNRSSEMFPIVVLSFFYCAFNPAIHILLYKHGLIWI